MYMYVLFRFLGEIGQMMILTERNDIFRQRALTFLVGFHLPEIGATPLILILPKL